MAQPRGFKVSLDLPIYEQSQMKGRGLTARDYEQNKPILQTKENVPFQRGLNISQFQNPVRAPKKDPNFRENVYEASTSNVKVNPTIPLLAAALKPLKIIVSHMDKKDPVKNSYIEPGQLSSIHAKQKSPTSQTGEKNRGQLGLAWSNYPDTGPKQTLQRPYESTNTRPTGDKLTSAWQLNYHKTQRNHENPPLGVSLKPERPDSTKLQSLPILTYPEHLGLTKAQTSPTRKDEDKVQPYSIQKQNLFPLQNEGTQDHKPVAIGSPSISRVQNIYTKSGAYIKDLMSNQKGENVKDAAVLSLQMGLSFPVKTLLSNVSRGNGGYLNIKPQSVGSLFTPYMVAAKPQSNSPRSDLTWSVSDFGDAKRTNELNERNWPILNLDIGPKQKKPTYVPVSTDGRPDFLSWFPNPQVGQEKTTRAQSLHPKKPDPRKPLPILAISKYLVDLTQPSKNDKYQAFHPKPLQSERVQSLYSLKPSTNSYIQGQTGPSLSLSSSTYDSSLFKPSRDPQLNVERTHSSSYHPPLTYGISPFTSPDLEAVPAEKPQRQKLIYSPYQYNSGRDASHDSTFEAGTALHRIPSGFQSQKNSPEQNAYGPNQNGKGYYVKPSDISGGGTIFGQMYQTGKNAARTPIKVKPPCDSSSSRLNHYGASNLHYPYLTAEPQPCSQVPCMDGVGKCFNELEKQNSNFPQRVSYSPTAEKTSISIPFSSFERFFYSKLPA